MVWLVLLGIAIYLAPGWLAFKWAARANMRDTGDLYLSGFLGATAWLCWPFVLILIFFARLARKVIGAG